MLRMKHDKASWAEKTPNEVEWELFVVKVMPVFPQLTLAQKQTSSQSSASLPRRSIPSQTGHRCPEQTAPSGTRGSSSPTVLLAFKFQVFAFKHKTGTDIHSLLFARTLASYKRLTGIS